jgi:hypothetical protein
MCQELPDHIKQSLLLPPPLTIGCLKTLGAGSWRYTEERDMIFRVPKGMGGNCRPISHFCVPGPAVLLACVAVVEGILKGVASSRKI